MMQRIKYWALFPKLGTPRRLWKEQSAAEKRLKALPGYSEARAAMQRPLIGFMLLWIYGPMFLFMGIFLLANAAGWLNFIPGWE